MHGEICDHAQITGKRMQLCNQRFQDLLPLRRTWIDSVQSTGGHAVRAC